MRAPSDVMQLAKVAALKEIRKVRDHKANSNEYQLPKNGIFSLNGLLPVRAKRKI